MYIDDLKDRVLNGENIGKEEALKLYNGDYNTLIEASREIREHFLGNKFDLCTIINSKSGKCSENCKFCAQSAHYNTQVDIYNLLPKEVIIEDALKRYEEGIPRYSLVSSGRRLTAEDIDKVCEIVKEIKDSVPLKICISGGLIDREGFKKLRAAGVERVHNNLESSRDYFKEVCTTHSYDEKLKAIENAKKAGMEVCSGGIIGLGEEIGDRIDMAILLRELEIDSIPINVLNPIKNTPFENNEILSQDEINKTIAVFRFINPKAYIRLAGGRALMEEFGRTAFLAGANAAITGDMLTTFGISCVDDIKMIKELDYVIAN